MSFWIRDNAGGLACVAVAAECSEVVEFIAAAVSHRNLVVNMEDHTVALG